MTSAKPAPKPPSDPRRRRLHLAGLLLALCVLLAVLLSIAAAARTALAVSLATNWLKSRGVAAAIQITALSDHALTAKVRLGSPLHPDLTIDRLDMTYRLSGPWSDAKSSFTPLTVRLVRPRLRLGFHDGRLDYGGLTPLVSWFATLPPSHQALPDMTVSGAELEVATPQGPVRASGDGAFVGGRLDFARLRLASFRTKDGPVTVVSSGGRLRLDRHGDRLGAVLDLGPLTAQTASGRVGFGALRLDADLPEPAGALAGGPVRLQLRSSDVQGSGAPGALQPTNLTASFIGDARGGANRQTLSGALTADIAAAGLDGQGRSQTAKTLSAQSLRLKLDASHFVLTHDNEGLAASGVGGVQVSLAHLQSGGVNLSGLSGDLQVRRAEVAMTHNGLSLLGDVNLTGRARGSLTGLASAKPMAGGADPGLNAELQSLNRALSDVTLSAQGWRLTLDHDGAEARFAGTANLVAASGARVSLGGALTARGLTFSPAGFSDVTGSGQAALSGGGLPSLKLDLASLSVKPAGLTALFTAALAVDTAQIREGRLTLRGGLTGSAGAFALRLSDCADLAAKQIDAGAGRLTDVSGRICPQIGPLIDLQGDGWRLSGVLRDLAARAPDPAIAVQSPRVDIAAAGSSGGLVTARLALDPARILDTATPQRFQTLSVSGTLVVDHDRLDGTAQLGPEGSAARLGVQLTDDLKTAAGRLAFDTGTVVFAPAGLQPLTLTPLATFARQAKGEVRAQGRLDWGAGRAMQSRGEVLASHLDFISPLGPVKDLNSDLHFTSLWPLVSAPGQEIRIAELGAVTPVTQIETQFDLAADRLTVDRAAAVLAGGDVHLEPFTTALNASARFTDVLDIRQVDIGEVLAATSLADEVKLQAKLDGRVPFTVGPEGVTVQKGSLAAVGGGRLSISPRALTGVAASKVAGATGGAPQSNFAQDIAAQAMENLAFTRLDADLASLPGDRMGFIFHVKGRHDPPQPKRALIPLMDMVEGRALAKPLVLPSGTEINLTLDTSLNFGELMTALATAWREALQPIGEASALKRSPAQIVSKPSVVKGTQP